MYDDEWGCVSMTDESQSPLYDPGKPFTLHREECVRYTIVHGKSGNYLKWIEGDAITGPCHDWVDSYEDASLFKDQETAVAVLSMLCYYDHQLANHYPRVHGSISEYYKLSYGPLFD